MSTSVRAAVAGAYARIAASGRPELWITLRPLAEALAAADAVDAAAAAAGAPLPLAGLTLAVKDNIDVAGLPTTAGCPAFAFTPDATAPAVARLEAAGAVVVGKTNLDQFATGLVGTRSPYGAVTDAERSTHVAGGSSSGSAVAVALGLVDLALGTDTAGSGRVPAAFGGIVGVKPTIGLVPTAGVLPACRTLDCVTVFAREPGVATQAAALMAGPDPADPRNRAWPPDAPLAPSSRPRIGVPDAAGLAALTDPARRAFAAAAARLACGGGACDAGPRESAATARPARGDGAYDGGPGARATDTGRAGPAARGDDSAVEGCELVEIDIAPLLEAGTLLYEGAFVAERYAAVGTFVDAHPDAVDPTVGAIIRAAREPAAHTLASDVARLDALKLRTHALLADLDALLLPTTTRQPTLAEVAAEPIMANARLGVYTNGANLLDLCAIAIPAGRADGGHFGVSLLAPAFHDAVIARIAGAAAPGWGPPGIPLFVVGAHRRGQPLNHELTTRGAAYLDTVLTTATYRLHALATSPPKPGLVRGGETAIEGERWRLPPAGLASFLAALPPPMALTAVDLADGTSVVGFTCEASALDGAPDISRHGSWPAYLVSRSVSFS